MCRGATEDINEGTEVGQKKDEVDPKKPEPIGSLYLISYRLVS